MEEGAVGTKQVELGRYTVCLNKGGEGKKEEVLCVRTAQDTLRWKQTDQVDPAQGHGPLSQCSLLSSASLCIHNAVKE